MDCGDIKSVKNLRDKLENYKKNIVRYVFGVNAILCVDTKRCIYGASLNLHFHIRRKLKHFKIDRDYSTTLVETAKDSEKNWNISMKPDLSSTSVNLENY